MKQRSVGKLLRLIAVLTFAGSVVGQTDLSKSQRFLEQDRRIQDQIAELESQYGPYSPELLEPLQALAELNSGAGDYPAVSEILSRQLQIQRTELGLDHPENVTLVNTIIANNIRLGEWSDVADNLEHIRYLQGVNTDAESDALLKAIDDQASWSQARIYLDEPRYRARNLLQAREFYEDIEDVAEDIYDEESIEIVPWLYKRALNLYQLVAILNGGNSLSGDALQRLVREDGVSRLQLYNSRFAGGLNPVFGPGNQIPVLDGDSLIGEAYLREALSLVRTITRIMEEQGDIEAQAMAQVYYGDFRALLGLAGSRSYRKAQELMEEAGIERQQIEAFFSQPQVIPIEKLAFTLAEATTLQQATLVPSISDEKELVPQFIALEESAGNVQMPASFVDLWGLELPAQSVEMSLNINSRGEVSAPEFITSNSDDKSIRRRALRSVRGLRFRPRLEAGKAVRVKDMKLLYRFQATNR